MGSVIDDPRGQAMMKTVAALCMIIALAASAENPDSWEESAPVEHAMDLQLAQSDSTDPLHPHMHAYFKKAIEFIDDEAARIVHEQRMLAVEGLLEMVQDNANMVQIDEKTANDFAKLVEISTSKQAAPKPSRHLLGSGRRRNPPPCPPCKCNGPRIWPFSGCHVRCGAKCGGQCCSTKFGRAVIGTVKKV